MSQNSALIALGWQSFFQQQLSLEEWESCAPARVIEQQRSLFKVAGDFRECSITIGPAMPDIVVGDWVLLNDDLSFNRLLDRKTCFARKAAGTQIKKQLISANVDTAFIVSSMNEEFNLSRIERFLALVNEAGAEPVIVLSKADQTEDAHNFIEQVQGLDPCLMVEAVNGLDAACISTLAAWTKQGVTIAVLGSSGVGKSTLINSLLGNAQQETGGIREDDAKGRHTTTSRSLISLNGGGLIIDTPGMREIQMADSKEGISKTFSDIEVLAERCKYADCRHQDEPGCAVKNALQSGELDSRRLSNYIKLLKEEAFNSATLSEKRASDKALAKYYKTVLSGATKLKGR
jgi:ribosome biogenesis GTPase